MIHESNQTDAILVINCGSSSLKCALWSADHRCYFSAICERLGTSEASVQVSIGAVQTLQCAGADHDHAMRVLLEILAEHHLLEMVTAVGHRVVHGGAHFCTATRIDAEVMQVLEDHVHLAPLHNPANIIGIRAAQKALPDRAHVAIFDTAFHQTMPARAYHYALPYHIYEDHAVRRYGFHGSSHSWVSQQARAQLDLDQHDHGIITAHLGNGCSVCAVVNGESQDSSMGFTPLAGVVMGTRSGDVDPGLFSFLQSQCAMSIDDIHNMLNKQSGLLGMSGISNDMREVLRAADAGHQRAQLAIDVFCYQLARSISSMSVAMTRLDALVFTGGIGEHAARIRQQTVSHLSLLSLFVSDPKNQEHGDKSGGLISAKDSRAILVIATNEELQIARDSMQCLAM